MDRSKGNYWAAGTAPGVFPNLNGDVVVDVAIIGGGIVGLSAARAMKDLGFRVAVIEALKVGFQVTGQSTAKVTSQHRNVYRALNRSFGEHLARLYADAQETALRRIQEHVSAYGIDCDLKRIPAFVYTRSEHHVREIEEEVEVARRLGLPASLVRDTDLPFDILAASCFEDQAQFHPIKYLIGLAKTIPGDGSHVFENSRAIDWSPTRVETERGGVTAKYVVMATHLPLGQIGMYYALAHPYAEPVVAAKIGIAPAGMYINVERPTHSFRTHEQDGQIFGIAVGSRFKPGDTKAERESFREIERWLAVTFDAGPIAYRWVNEDFTSIDGAPFVGWSASTGDAYLVATGFGAWGITNGTAAGLMLADLVAGKDNRWLELFDARRVKPVSGAPAFLSENAQIAAHLVGGYFSGSGKALADLANDEASITTFDGETVAAYRDTRGKLHMVSAACTHMGCRLGWNATDRTWDCFCHGSRFAFDGAVLHGPAVTPLAQKGIAERTAAREAAE